MGKKSGKAGKAVAPAAPDKPEDADVADPGQMAEVKTEQLKKKEGKYGSEQVKPHKPPETEEEADKKSWIEIELVDEEDEPVSGEKYKITLPDDTVAEGTLDEEGFAGIDGIEPGNCKITFPDLDKGAWKRAGAAEDVGVSQQTAQAAAGRTQAPAEDAATTGKGTVIVTVSEDTTGAKIDSAIVEIEGAGKEGASDGFYYTVKSGDWLSKIAIRYGIASWKVIYNHDKNGDFRKLRPDPNLIYPGDSVWIPCAKSDSPAEGATETDFEGVAEFANLEAGEYYFEASKESFSSTSESSKTVQVEAATTTPVNLTLHDERSEMKEKLLKEREELIKKIANNGKKMDNMRTWLEGEDPSKFKEWYWYVLEFLSKVLAGGRGDPYDPTGGGLAEALEQQYDDKYNEEVRKPRLEELVAETLDLEERVKLLDKEINELNEGR